MNRRHLLSTLALLPLAALIPGGCSKKSVVIPSAVDGSPPATGNLLFPGVAADVNTFTTLANLQRHTEWVSHPAGEVPELLKNAGFSLVDGVIDPNGIGGQTYVAERNGDVVVSFRGSGSDTDFKTFENILADTNVVRAVPHELITDAGDARVHDGFYRNYLRFRDTIHQRIRSASGERIYVTGFSLGSALACFCGLDLKVNLGLVPTVHMLGTPRTGNVAWRALWQGHLSAGLRMSLEEDPVSRVPLHVDEHSGFSHLSNLLVLAFDGTPITADKVDGQLTDFHKEEETFKAHNRDKYAAAIQTFLAHFVEDNNILGLPPTESPLTRIALAEANSVEHLK